MTAQRPRAVSGMRPTGPLHLGHYFGALKNWVDMQEDVEPYFFVADWHALTTDFDEPAAVQENSLEMVKDWLASGLDQEKCVIFRQSSIKAHAELALLLSMITPVSWLERNPAYKEQRREIASKDLGNAGFLCYPILMAADILMYMPHWAPVGQDQLPHLELAREIARRFNQLYGQTFPEPEARPALASQCSGLDGRRMSKSYGNGIFLRESMETIAAKVKGMVADPARLRGTDPGAPDRCNLFPYHMLLASSEEQAEIREGCAGAKLGCVECKGVFLKNLKEMLEPLQQRRVFLDHNPDLVREVVHRGNVRARKFAHKTIATARKKMGL